MLVVDNAPLRKSRPSAPRDAGTTELERRRRQSIIGTEIINARVKVYLGGAENMPMFKGCIGRPMIRG